MRAPDVHTERDRGAAIAVGEGSIFQFPSRRLRLYFGALLLCNQLPSSGAEGFLSAIVLEEAEILQRQTNKSQQG